MRFYYTDGEITDGPLTEDELVTDYVNGALNEGVRVRRENSETWLPIRSVVMQIKMKSAPKAQKSEEEVYEDEEPEATSPSGSTIAQIFCCIFLAFIAAVVLVQFNKFEKPKPPAQYEYAALKITSEDLFRSDMVNGQEAQGMVRCDSLMGIPDGWEYVSTLCPDGDKATWILVRRLKAEKVKKDKIKS